MFGRRYNMARRKVAYLAQSPVDEKVFCARHADVETYLRCQACGTPICPRCLVQTPVGAKCPDCARVRKLVTYQISPVYYVRAAAAALVAGALVGVLWGLVLPPRGGFVTIFSLFAGAFVGWVIGEAIGRAANRKRGMGLAGLAVAGVVVAYLIRNLVAGADVLPANDAGGWVLAIFAAVMAAYSLR